MYKKCYSEQIGEDLHKIYLWDDEEGYSEFEWKDKMGFDGMYPYQKYLIEKYGIDNEVSKNHQIIYFDIECESITNWTNLWENDSKIYSIVYYHQNEDKWVCLLVDNEDRVKNQSYDNKSILIFNSEKELLKYFILDLERIGVDIIIGWNSDRFDIPYTYIRTNLCLGDKWSNRLSPIGKVVDSSGFNFDSPYQIFGVESIDFLRVHKSLFQKEEDSYKLDYIGEKYCDINKLTYRGTLDDLYQSDIRRFVEYNIRDVEILVELNNRLDYLPLVINVSHRGKVNYGDYYLKSRINDGSITSKMINKYGLESIPNIDTQLEKEDVIGGYLFIHKKGLYKNMFDLDLVSMYPSIIMSLNISIDTYHCRILTDSLKWYDWRDDNVNIWLGLSDLKKRNPSEKIIIEFLQSTTIKNNKLIKLKNKKKRRLNTTIGEFIEYVESNNLSISANGVCYDLDKDSSQSMVINEWFNERKEYKSLMLKYKDEGNIEMEDYYNLKQKTIKILMNSIYGCNTLLSFRWGNTIIANSITMSGRRVIIESAKFANTYLNKVLRNEVKLDL